MGSLRLVPLFSVLHHSSQWPAALKRELLSGLRNGMVSHKFLYDGHKQTAKWLRLHAKCSPASADADCKRIYSAAAHWAGQRINGRNLHLVSLGCGGGNKDAALLSSARKSAGAILYTAIDVSAPMVLAATNHVLQVVPKVHSSRIVCDLSKTNDLGQILREVERKELHAGPVTRVVAFFGMIPNFRPSGILPKLAALLRPEDSLLFSANLAPGEDYLKGTRKVLPQYDNAWTRDWLRGFLDSLGVPKSSGEIRFSIQLCDGLYQIAAHYFFRVPCVVHVEGETVSFKAGSSLLLFYSFRHTPATIRKLLARHKMSIADEWVARSGEEGVFAACKRPQ